MSTFICRAPGHDREGLIDADSARAAAELFGARMFEPVDAIDVYPLAVEVQEGETVETFDVEVEAVPQFYARPRKRTEER